MEKDRIRTMTVWKERIKGTKSVYPPEHYILPVSGSESVFKSHHSTVASKHL